MEVEIRAAEPGEEEPLLDALEWLFEPPGARPGSWDRKQAAVALRQTIESPDSVVLVAEDARAQLTGFCTAYLTIDSVRFGLRAWVEELAVHPEHRSEGIGRRLLAASRDWARERGASHLKLDSAVARTDAHRFYERERPSARAFSYIWEL